MTAIPASATPLPVKPTVAILIPCYNEELTIAGVVDDFRSALPGARIYVFDNNSADRTADGFAEIGRDAADDLVADGPRDVARNDLTGRHPAALDVGAGHGHRLSAARWIAQ